MARLRIEMYKLREILRLKYECGLSDRQVAKGCAVSRRTVGIYWKQAQAAGLDWAQAKRLDDTELEQAVWGSDRPGSRGTNTLPDFHYIYRELKRPHVTLELLWQEYREENPNGCGYSWFQERYSKWRKKLNVWMRQEHRAGEKVFVDYCAGLYLTDPVTGEKTQTQLFVGVWGASNYTYAEASLGQKKEAWAAHVRLFEYSGAVPRLVVPDNLKSGVTKACRYEPEINRTYLDLAQHYGTTIIPARPGKPKDKAKVEAGVLLAQRWILACLRNRTFYSLAEMNQAIRELLERLNNRRMRRLDRSRKELFETLDRQAALPLPERRYEYADWKKARVNIDYHIEIERHRYSVPYQLVHEQVDVRLTGHVIEVFYKNRRTTSHARSWVRGGYTTKLEHLPPAHRKHLAWTPERMMDWAGKTGECTKEVVTTIIAGKKHPALAYRSCLGILRLGNCYPRERIENAARRALKFRTCSYQNMKAILAHGLDKQTDLFSGPVNLVSPAHENIRGQEYYRESDGQPQ
jgi:transposase